MSSGIWKRASVSLVAGALAAVIASPLASLAASPAVVASVLPPAPDPAQFGGFAQCQALGGGGLMSAGLQQGGLSQVYSFGAGSFYGPYYNPAYSSYGLGTVGTFLNFSGGQPRRLPRSWARPIARASASWRPRRRAAPSWCATSAYPVHRSSGSKVPASARSESAPSAWAASAASGGSARSASGSDNSRESHSEAAASVGAPLARKEAA